MAFNATLNNISILMWRSFLLVEETGVSGEKTTDLPQVTDKLYHIMLYTSPEWDSNSHVSGDKHRMNVKLSITF